VGRERRREICAEIAIRLRRITVVVDHAIARNAPAELTANSAVAVLTALVDHGPQRPRELLESVPITSGGLSKLLDRLEQLGLVERRVPVGVDDGRAITIHLSARGRRQWNRLQTVSLDALGSCAADAKEILRLCDDAGAAPAGDSGETVDLLHFGSRLGLGLADIIESRSSVALEVNDFIVLAVAFVEGPVRPRRIVDAVGLTSGGTTKLVDRLVTNGLVSRKFGALDDDHRAVLVSITRAGERTLLPVLDGIGEQIGAIRSLMQSLMRSSAH
jgi:DNA-binding MarR family transcriptional regulator